MFAGRAAFVSPADGKNPNRCFPGDPNGTYSEQLAHHVFTELIAPSDALVDVHGGDLVEALEPFTLHDESPVGDRARAMAVAYGLPYVVCPEPDGTAIGGTTSEAAAAAGHPGDHPRGGRMRPARGGRDRSARARARERPARARHAAGRGRAARAAHSAWSAASSGRGRRPAGWWQPDVRPGEAVAAGARLGAVCDLFGEELEVVSAPEAGVPLFVTSSPAVAADGILLGLGAGISEM